jgi:NAD dependent epimerase/dehydratase family enzyme
VDEIRAIRFLFENENAHGPFNVIAPNPVRNAELATVIGATMNRPAVFPVPGFALRIVLGEVATMVLEGQRAIPKRLQNLGFTFQFPDLGPALRDILSS